MTETFFASQPSVKGDPLTTLVLAPLFECLEVSNPFTPCAYQTEQVTAVQSVITGRC